MHKTKKKEKRRKVNKQLKLKELGEKNENWTLGPNPYKGTGCVYLIWQHFMSMIDHIDKASFH